MTFYLNKIFKYLRLWGTLHLALQLTYSHHNGILLHAEFSLLKDFERHRFTRFCEDHTVLKLVNTSSTHPLSYISMSAM